MERTKRTALLIGASGLVGGFCLERLLQDQANGYDKVIAVVRKPLLKTHPKLDQQIIDFDQLERYRDVLCADDIYCCIGTTRLKSPNWADYSKVDFTYPFEMAKIAKENGAEQFSLISAISVNEKSLFFYSRVKAQLENAIDSLKYKSLNIFRPSFLVGKRAEKRPIEIIGLAALRLFSPFLIGAFRKYRPIEAKVVAEAMVEFSLKHKPGVHILLSDEIQDTYNKL